jgi:hypothetical protein
MSMDIIRTDRPDVHIVVEDATITEPGYARSVVYERDTDDAKGYAEALAAMLSIPAALKTA